MSTVVRFNQFGKSNVDQMRTKFDASRSVMWFYMRPEPRPCFTYGCMKSLYFNQSYLEHHQGSFYEDNALHQVHYLVLASDVPGIYNLGGDLSVFAQHIREQRRQELLTYAKLCVDNVWTFYNMDAPITTIALVQGQAMGGGFEAALSAHVLIAERSAQMGLPEVLFNLFPGMGAMSFLSRKVGVHMAETMIRSGKIYTAVELHQMGVVDVLAEDGEGEQALNAWIDKHDRSRNAYQAIRRAKHRVNPLTLQELYDITEIWVDAALRLEERNLKVMERLVRAQNSKVTTQPSQSTQPQRA